jgi:hypothetical protein
MNRVDKNQPEPAVHHIYAGQYFPTWQPLQYGNWKAPPLLAQLFEKY